MSTPTNLPVGAMAIADRSTGNELKPNADGSLNAITSVGAALSAYSSNPSATGTGTDVPYKFGPTGTTPFTHCAIQNNTTAKIFYAFDQDTTTTGHMVYSLDVGQLTTWDRAGTIIHFQTAAEQNFGGTAGITVEAFA